MLLTRRLGSPFNCSGIAGPRTITVIMIRTMLKRAIALARLKLSMDRYRESGKEMVNVQAIIMKARDAKKDPSRDGTIDLSTCGMVSPITTIKAHIPPKAKVPWKTDTAKRPFRPKQ